MRKISVLLAFSFISLPLVHLGQAGPLIVTNAILPSNGDVAAGQEQKE